MFVCVIQIIAEVVGTYVFVFAGRGAALVYREDPTALAAAFIPALALMAMIYAVGHVSRAHFNPAVTVAFAMARRLIALHPNDRANGALCGVAIGGALLLNTLIGG
ncbi:hypothetical protein SASPL_103094 [Salvia splendens]|uniref:Aquaporin NIP n=1 Tax=Salvia splendens TaxID=180675 RepID=A0A8X8YX35_SALSN|nr:hypothetical protein SASPL_103094 [Salvia splendens]